MSFSPISKIVEKEKAFLELNKNLPNQVKSKKELEIKVKKIFLQKNGEAGVANLNTTKEFLKIKINDELNKKTREVFLGKFSGLEETRLEGFSKIIIKTILKLGSYLNIGDEEVKEYKNIIRMLDKEIKSPGGARKELLIEQVSSIKNQMKEIENIKNFINVNENALKEVKSQIDSLKEKINENSEDPANSGYQTEVDVLEKNYKFLEVRSELFQIKRDLSPFAELTSNSNTPKNVVEGKENSVVIKEIEKKIEALREKLPQLEQKNLEKFKKELEEQVQILEKFKKIF